ncbi:Protein kinase domain-containing protein [Meloidogyne graminicola]|uniref:phosphorylase kinase n=1 Tax=Meloidogyne graminicola TaxID=189291 RepID=A0A8S9ZFP9_9BILA|nr:Protein kinase domain-containing protein [Meloidogyne graminicola]
MIISNNEQMAVEQNLENSLQGEKAPLDISYSSEAGFYKAYELQEIIGRGISSVVRKCLENETKRPYAVKIVDVTDERQSEKDAKLALEETLSEVKLLKMLSGHPYIVKLHDFYPSPTFLFIVFEFASEELFEKLNRAVKFSEKKTRHIMQQLFEGIRFIHDKMIVHRDLKLENILVINDDRVVISDFGFAKQLKSGQLLKDLVGTPGYLAPETLRCQMNEDADGIFIEVDNWALGVIMYTMLSGYAPFYHRQQLRMMRMIQEGKYEFKKEHWENISDGAKDLIQRLLTVPVSKRILSSESLNHPWMLSKSDNELGRWDPRKLFRIAQHSIRFLVRAKNSKKSETDEGCLNIGFFHTREMFFANKQKSKMHRRPGSLEKILQKGKNLVWRV